MKIEVNGKEIDVNIQLIGNMIKYYTKPDCKKLNNYDKEKIAQRIEEIINHDYEEQKEQLNVNTRMPYEIT